MHARSPTEFQRQAVDCQNTILLESGIGHATRCLGTPFADEFGGLKQDLMREGKSSDEIRLELEMLNIGRLRLASKGVERTTDPRDAGRKGRMVTVEPAAQSRRGMFMIGQVAALRDPAAAAWPSFMPRRRLAARKASQAGRPAVALATRRATVKRPQPSRSWAWPDVSRRSDVRALLGKHRPWLKRHPRSARDPLALE